MYVWVKHGYGSVYQELSVVCLPKEMLQALTWKEAVALALWRTEP